MSQAAQCYQECNVQMNEIKFFNLIFVLFLLCAIHIEWRLLSKCNCAHKNCGQVCINFSRKTTTSTNIMPFYQTSMLYKQSIWNSLNFYLNCVCIINSNYVKRPSHTFKKQMSHLCKGSRWVKSPWPYLHYEFFELNCIWYFCNNVTLSYAFY